MKQLESIVFLFLCATVPLAMVTFLVVRFVRWVHAKRSWAEDLRAHGLAPTSDDSAVRVVLEETGVATPRTILSWSPTVLMGDNRLSAVGHATCLKFEDATRGRRAAKARREPATAAPADRSDRSATQAGPSAEARAGSLR